MNYRRWTQIAEWSLLGLVVALHMVAALAPRWSGMDAFDGLLLDAIPIAQLVLLIAWTVLGPGPWWLRMTAGPLAIAVVLILRISQRTLGGEYFTQLLAALGTTTFMVVLGARLSGLAIQQRSSLKEPGGSRFSIRTLFIVTTLVALMVGGLEALRPQLNPRPIDPLGDPAVEAQISADRAARAEVVRQTLMIAVILATCLGGVWAVVRPGTMWMRLALVGICGPAATAYVASLSAAPQYILLTLPVWNVAMLLIIVLSLAPLRLLNYRLDMLTKSATSDGDREAIVLPHSPQKAVAMIGVLVILAVGIPLSEPFRHFENPHVQRRYSNYEGYVSPQRQIYWLLCPTSPLPPAIPSDAKESEAERL